MLTTSIYRISWIITILISTIDVFAEVVRHYPCQSFNTPVAPQAVFTSKEKNVSLIDVIDKSNTESRNCKIHEVRVNPCPEVINDQNRRCSIKRGRQLHIEFDFSPHNNHTIQNEIYRVNSSRGFLPWANYFDTTRVEEMDSFSFNLTVSKSTPPVSFQFLIFFVKALIHFLFIQRPYDIKWKIQNNKQQNCCFIIKIVVWK